MCIGHFWFLIYGGNIKKRKVLVSREEDRTAQNVGSETGKSPLGSRRFVNQCCQWTHAKKS